VIHDSPGGLFLSGLELIRDQRLDLNNKEELLRPELDYPETLGRYNSYMADVFERKTIRSGWLRARYECVEWYRTNDLVIPLASKLRAYVPPPNGSYPARVFDLRANEFIFRDAIDDLIPQIRAPTVVNDYRYKRASKTRIFKYGEYTLNPGDAWKSANDPALSAKAEDWLKNGRKFTDFAGVGKRWVAWLLRGLLISPVLAMWRKYKHERTNRA